METYNINGVEIQYDTFDLVNLELYTNGVTEIADVGKRVKEMIQDVDRSTVLDSGVIDSPVLGKIPPTGLSGGVKTLILVKFEKDKIFNASTCGDNCAKWLLKIAASQDRTINLHHLMEFGEEPFQIRILNTDQVVCSMRELISIAGEFV